VRAAIVLIVAAGVLGAACSSSAKSSGSTTTTAGATTTAVTTTTASTSAASTSTTIATATKQSVFVLAVDPAKHTVTVDPMEFLTGSAATAAYHKANPQAPPGGPPNDYYIVNPTKDREVMTLDPDVHVRVVQAGGTVHNPPVSVPLASLANYPTLALHPFWITIERGLVTQIDEQFVP
jgi:hypothetical protein